MSYSTPEELRVGKRNLPSSITDEDLQVFCDRATAYINGKLANAFQVPFSPVPPLLNQIANDLSSYLFIEAMYTSQKPNLDEFYLNLKERLDANLQEILNGDLILTDEWGTVIKPLPTWKSGFATTNDDEPFFTRDYPNWYPEWGN